MAKAQVARKTVAKAKDKWKAKQWYSIQAPRMFNAVPIAETLAENPEHLVGRVAEATMQDLTGDIGKMHIKCYFKVSAVTGTSCQTRFVGHELTSDYIRRLTRRKHSKIDNVVDVTTKDGYLIRVKPMAVTEKRAQSAQESEIRHRTEDVVQKLGSEKTMAEFVRDIINGELSGAIFKECKLVYPLKRVELRKSEVRKEPSGEVEEQLMFNQPKPEEPAAEGVPPTEGEPASPAEQPEEPAPASDERAPEEQL
ncbi:MAG: 30S ribosomal protein S3ae [Halobacteriales archaeon]|nr:30S ribosomal protein S3ae [Halobacteriales archaeon]